MVEASFQAEYGIDLTEALPRMTWRRFFVLLSGLPPHSSYVQAVVHRRRQEQEIISDPEEAERYVAAMLG